MSKYKAILKSNDPKSNYVIRITADSISSAIRQIQNAKRFTNSHTNYRLVSITRLKRSA